MIALIRVRFLLILVVLLMLFLAGCGPASRKAAASAVPVTGAPAARFPEGVYVASHYKMKFEGNHYTQLTEFDQEWAQGGFVIDGDRIKFTETDVPPECKPEYNHYSYQWSFDGKALTLSRPDDPCLTRLNFYTGAPWVLAAAK